jgi:WD40 repeat protein
MNDVARASDRLSWPSLGHSERVDRVCNLYEDSWQEGNRPDLSRYLVAVDPAEQFELIRELLLIDLHYRRGLGESPTLEEYQARHPAVDFGPCAELFTAAAPAADASLNDLATQSTPCNSPVPTAVVPRVGKLGDYELLEEIARGGMGVVYKARQVSLNRLVAVKMILAGLFATKADHDRFHSEAQAAAILDHPNIVPVYEVGEFEGQHYFSMGYVDGQSLTARLADGPLPPKEAAELAVEVARAVEYAHRHGVIHRDIKPSNILIDSSGRPRVTDFGLAKRVDSGSDLTATGQVLGTPSYMAPEQAAGQTDAVGPAADVYALGALLYTTLTGRPPFQAATSLETLQQVLDREPLALRQINPAVPLDLETIVLKCLEKSIPRRYATAEALADDLRRYLEGRPILARPVGRLGYAWRWCRRQPVVASLIAGVALTLVAGIVVSSRFALVAEAKRVEAVAARNDADRAVLQTRRQLATATLERALALCEQGSLARGVLWLGRGLQLAHEAGADDVEQDCRWNLAAWTCQFHHLQFVLPHPEAVLAVALSADGQTVASGCKDGKLRLWKIATGESLAAPLAHKSAVKVVAFHPYEPLILAGCDDGTVTLWDLQTRTRRGPLLHHDGPLSSVAFSPDGESILTGSFDGTAKLWKTGTGEMIGRPLDLESGRCPSRTKGVVAAFSPDGRSVVTSGGNIWQVKFWDARTTKYKNRSFGAGSIVFSIAWCPGSNSILLGLMQNRVAMQREAETGRQIGLPLAHLGYVESVAYSADGRTIVTGAGDNCVRLWDTATGELRGAPMLHQKTVKSVAVSSDGQTIVSGSEDATVRIWKRAQGNLIRTIRGGTWTRAAAFSPDGRAVILGVFSNGARIWSAASGEIEQPFKSTAPNDEVEGVAFSPDGKTVFTQHSTLQVVKWWDRFTGKLLGSTQPQGDRIRQMALSPDGTTIFTRTDFTARLWNAATGRPIGSPLHFRDRVLGQAFHPDGKTVIISSADRTTRLWSGVSSDPLGPATSHSNEISALAYSPDGRTIVAAEGINSAQLFDARSWRPLKAPLEHGAAVRCVGFSPDGNVILTGCTDGTARLWYAATCRPLGPALRHNDVINVTTCSLDGKTFLTASDDATAKLWKMPEPLGGSIEEVGSSVQLSTGMRLDENDVVNALDFETWLANQKDLLGKPNAMAATSGRKPIATLNDPSFQQWMQGVAAMPADKQVEAVVQKLRELNPGFDGMVTAYEGTGVPKIEKGMVISFGFLTTAVTDISPVRALAGLEKLRCGGSAAAKGALSDLAPLKGMPLSALDCSWSEVSDLAPLKGMPLTYLHCTGTSVTDLSAIRGMQLAQLYCGLTEVSDLSPLKGMRLTFLNCGTTRVSDLSPLTGMKLTSLYCDRTNVSDISPLQGMPLESLICFATPLSDLSPLKGMRLTRLDCGQTHASDLSPLKGMPMTYLNCGTTRVSDLSPLKGMKLRKLFCDNTIVSDLSPLKGMQLVELYCFATPLSDLSQLEGMNLREVALTPKNITKGIDIIRQMKNLNKISTGEANNQSYRPDAFWKKYDAGEFGKPASTTSTLGR